MFFLLLTRISVLGVEFPKRFSAIISYESSWGKTIGCQGTPLVNKVYQDIPNNHTLWSHSARTGGYEQILITIPSSTANPNTPEATHLTKFRWKSDTSFEGCVYQLNFEYNRNAVPEFFGFSTPVLEKREMVEGIECEKWSNKANASISDEYWAVWYPVKAKPPRSVVLRAYYYFPPSPPHTFPVPACTTQYNFSDFTIDPIPPERFTPPKDWLHICEDYDEGIVKHRIPGRQDGYICVTPEKDNSFSINLQTRPVHDVSVQINPCSHDDSCIDGDRCKECVKFSATSLTFTPTNWSQPQTVTLEYLADGDSQYIFKSPNYYLNNTYESQFSTCACVTGKNCTNECNLFCG